MQLRAVLTGVRWIIAGTAWGRSGRDWVGGPMGSGFGTRPLVRWLQTHR